MKKFFKYLVPIICVFYGMAVLEIDFKDYQNTWNDEYDSYTAASGIKKISHHSCVFDLSEPPDPLSALKISAIAETGFSEVLSTIEETSTSSRPLFISNCTWII